MQKIICIDFDGTVCDHRFPEIGEEAPGAIEWLKAWKKEGIKLILHTMRSPGQSHGDVLADAVKWLDARGIILWGVNENPGQHHWTSSPKPYAPIYVDDAAFGCPLVHPEGFNRPCVDWSIVGPEVLKKFGLGEKKCL